jgi:hypothetical protein
MFRGKRCFDATRTASPGAVRVPKLGRLLFRPGEMTMSNNSFCPQIEALEDRQLLSASPLTTQSVIDTGSLVKQMTFDLNTQLSTLPGLTKSSIAAMDTLVEDFVDQHRFLRGLAKYGDISLIGGMEMDKAFEKWIAGLKHTDSKTVQDKMGNLMKDLMNAQGTLNSKLSAIDQAFSSGQLPKEQVIEAFAYIEIADYWKNAGFNMNDSWQL